MSDAFAAKTYGADRVGFGEKLGILVVDFQQAFTSSETALGGSAHVDAAVEQTVRLLQRARAAKLKVACCYVAYGTPDAMPHWKVRAVKTDLFRGMPGTELDSRIAEGGSEDYVFEKWGASAFFQTPLAAFFTRHRVDTLAVCGCTTSGCVRASLVDAFQFGFRTLMVQDACGDQEEGPHMDVIRDVGRRYADVVTVDEVIRWIDAQAAAAEEETPAKRLKKHELKAPSESCNAK